MQTTRSPLESRGGIRVNDRTNSEEKNLAFVQFIISWVLTAVWMSCILLRADFVFSGSFYYLNFGVTVALFAVMFGYFGRYIEFHDEQVHLRRR